MDDIFDYILKHESIHILIISAYWVSCFDEEGVLTGANRKYKNRIKDTLNVKEKN